MVDSEQERKNEVIVFFLNAPNGKEREKEGGVGGGGGTVSVWQNMALSAIVRFRLWCILHVDSVNTALISQAICIFYLSLILIIIYYSICNWSKNTTSVNSDVTTDRTFGHKLVRNTGQMRRCCR